MSLQSFKKYFKAFEQVCHENWQGTHRCCASTAWRLLGDCAAARYRSWLCLCHNSEIRATWDCLRPRDGAHNQRMAAEMEQPSQGSTKIYSWADKFWITSPARNYSWTGKGVNLYRIIIPRSLARTITAVKTKSNIPLNNWSKRCCRQVFQGLTDQDRWPWRCSVPSSLKTCLRKIRRL